MNANNPDTTIEKGGISVQTEHIFPIIKKWLYSEKEIFLREIVSNACDAVTKLQRLISLGEIKDPAITEDTFKITVALDADAKTLTVSDNGIGMDEDEVRRYICQIALSGALEFIEKYEGDTKDASQNGIIGHFGLGFYSSFMVSDTVDVLTRSYTGAPAVKWVCTESGEYEMESNYDKDSRGTAVVMHITEEEAEFLSPMKIREILDKYCSFMPIEIYLETGEPEEAAPTDEKEEPKAPEAPKPINDTHPLWQKLPSECTEEEYKEFYQKVFHDYKEPLFYIHINADYPLNFKGILYFPKLNHEYDNLEGQVKLYYNQVFVADNIKEVIPEYLLMLKGVLDCPELPLNVSRSYLQNSAYVAKISAHIMKKVTDKLTSLFNLEREKYEALWKDIKVFTEYACLRERKFYDRVKDVLLLEKADATYLTMQEYLEKAKEKHENTIYYASDRVAQAQYISMFQQQDIDVVVFDKLIESNFMQMIEQVQTGVKFMRIDADIANALKDDTKDPAKENAALTELFKDVSGNSELKVTFENLKDADIPAILNLSEQSRRMEEMMRVYRMDNKDMKMPQDITLVINAGSPLIQRVEKAIIQNNGNAQMMAKQIYTLALLSQRQLNADELKGFLSDSFRILGQF